MCFQEDVLEFQNNNLTVCDSDNLTKSFLGHCLKHCINLNHLITADHSNSGLPMAGFDKRFIKEEIDRAVRQKQYLEPVLNNADHFWMLVNP